MSVQRGPIGRCGHVLKFPKAGLLLYVYVSMLHGSVPLEYIVANHLPPPGPLNIHGPDSDSNSPQTNGPIAEFECLRMVANKG